MTVIQPIIPGFYPDPSICRVDKDYYLVTSSFEYFPGVPIFHSQDLIHWRQIGHCLTRNTQLPLTVYPERITHPLFGTNYSLGIYAPTLRYHDGIFYMITTNATDGRHIIVYTTDPAGEWSDPVWVDLRDQLGFSIDPSLMFDDDGTVYLTCNGQPQAIYQVVINPLTGAQLSEVRLLHKQFCARDIEGPHLYHIGKWYYLLVAEGGTGSGHMVALGRSASPWGPFEPSPVNPILTHAGKVEPVQATGHADIVQAHDGSWWLVCLGIRPGKYPHLHHIGRETFLTPLVWQDEWFTVPDQRLQLPQPAFATDTAPDSFDTPVEDDFSGKALAWHWNFLRNLEPDAWSLQDRPGWLRLTGNAYTLDEQYHAPAFIGRRQQHLACQTSCLIDFMPQHAHEEAGLSVYMNLLHHYDVAIAGIGAQRTVSLRRRIGWLQCVVSQVVVPEGAIRVIITATQEAYQFAIIDGNNVKHLLGAGETTYLCTEVAGGFTGVYHAMYATGHGQVATTPAYFTNFIYIPH